MNAFNLLGLVAPGWLGVEDKLVEFFGLDQSKYQWAVDEAIERQMVSSIFPGFCATCQIIL